jgi:hypothetical protein
MPLSREVSGELMAGVAKIDPDSMDPGRTPERVGAIQLPNQATNLAVN